MKSGKRKVVSNGKSLSKIFNVVETDTPEFQGSVLCYNIIEVIIYNNLTPDEKAALLCALSKSKNSKTRQRKA